MEETNIDSKQYIMTSLDKALKIIDILAKKPNISVTQITKLIDYHKSSLFKILYTLENNGFVTKNNYAQYSLSLKFVEYGNRALGSIDVYKTINSYVVELSKLVNETVHFTTLTADKLDVIVINKVDSTHNLQMNSKIGKTLPVYCTGTGKVLLSEYTDEEIKEMFERLELHKYTDTTITSYDDFKKEIEIIREAGYAVDNQESEYGLSCYAVAIKGFENQTVGAISISGQSHRILLNRDTYLAKLLEFKKKIEQEINCAK